MAAPSSSLPCTAPSMATICRPRNGAGTSSMSGTCRTRNDVVTASGALGAHSAQRLRTRCESFQSQTSQPAYADSIGNSRISSSVTTPRFPPPPRSAQKRSGLWSALAWVISPSATTSTTSVRLLVAMPSSRANQPIPPPSV